MTVSYKTPTSPDINFSTRTDGLSEEHQRVDCEGTTLHDAVATGVQPVLVGGYASAAAPTDVSGDGDAVKGWFLRNGSQVTNISSAGALIGGDATNGLDVDVTRIKPDGTNTMPSLDVATRRGYVQITDGTNSADVATAGADAQSNTSNRLRTTAHLSVFNGTTWDRMRGDSSHAYVGGNVAHDAVSSGNPILNGGEAIAHGTNPTAVAAGDRTKLYANRAGVPFVIGGHPNIQTVRLQFTAAQTNVAVITVSAGTKIVVTSFQVTLDNASTVFPSVRLGFGTANTPTTSQVIGAHGGLPAGGGFGRGDGSGIIGVGADDEDLRITTVGAATGNGVEVVVTYYTIES